MEKNSATLCHGKIYLGDRMHQREEGKKIYLAHSWVLENLLSSLGSGIHPAMQDKNVSICATLMIFVLKYQYCLFCGISVNWKN